MYDRFCYAIKNLRRGQKGITGLETAIILIAFVTVASVLAYSVLSAGIYSADKGKEAVYNGLESVRNTMVVKGTVLGLAGGGGTALTSVIFNMAMATNGDSIDLTKLAINYWDSDIVEPLALDAANSGDPSKSTVTPGDWSYYLSDGSAGSALKDNLAVYIVVAVPAGAAAFSYATITIQVIPPGASAVTIQRTLPPISAAMALA